MSLIEVGPGQVEFAVKDRTHRVEADGRAVASSVRTVEHGLDRTA